MRTVKLGLRQKYDAIPTDGYLGVGLVGTSHDSALIHFLYGRKKENCRFATLADGQITLHDLHVDPNELLDGPLLKKHPPTLVKSQGKFFLLINETHLLLLDPAFQLTRKIEIQNPFDQADRDRLGRTLFRPNLRPACSPSGRIPILFPAGLDATSLTVVGVLEIDLNQQSANWLTPNGCKLENLKSGDFPETHLANKEPVLYDALLRDDQLYIYTVGNSSGYVKYGMPYHGIVKYDQKLNLNSKPYFEHDDHHDEKRRGRLGRFTSSSKYCVVTPFFPTSDPWKKKQHLFDLDANEMVELRLPRGFSTYELIDHFDGTFWLVKKEPEHFLIASCVASN